MFVNKSSVRWTISFGNGNEIDWQLESAATLNAFLTACISFFLLICWPSSITKGNRSKILYKTKFKLTLIKFNEKRGFFFHVICLLWVLYDELNLFNIECEIF